MNWEVVRPHVKYRCVYANDPTIIGWVTRRSAGEWKAAVIQWNAATDMYSQHSPLDYHRSKENAQLWCDECAKHLMTEVES